MTGLTSPSAGAAAGYINYDDISRVFASQPLAAVEPRVSDTDAVCSIGHGIIRYRSWKQRAILFWQALPGISVTVHSQHKACVINVMVFIFWLYISGCAEIAQYSDPLRAGRSWDRIPVDARFYAHVQTGPGAHPPPSGAEVKERVDV